MYRHHKEAIEAITERLSGQEDVLGVVVGGSVAHGFAIENSDVDIMIVYSDEEYDRRLKSGDISFFDTDSTHYEGGYIDGKATCRGFIRKVAELGSEPAKFAYQDAIVTFDRCGGLRELVGQASRYPVERKKENTLKFYAQLRAWKWYYYEALKRGNRYLTEVSITNYVLFAGRLVLTANETLFPYHKWFMRVLENVKNKPRGFVPCLNAILELKKPEYVEKCYNMIEGFSECPDERAWPVRFMLDTELPWLEGKAAIGDL